MKIMAYVLHPNNQVEMATQRKRRRRTSIVVTAETTLVQHYAYSNDPDGQREE